MVARISSLLFLVLFFFIAYIASRFSYNRRFDVNYSIKNMFPFEFNYNSVFKDNFYGNTAFILSIFASLIFYIFYDTNYQNGIIIAIMILGIITSIMMGFLFFLPMKLYKLHFLFSSIFFAGTFGVSGLACILGFRLYQESNNTAQLVAFIIGAVITLFVFISLMNPKISRAIKLQERVLEDGSKVNIRPPFIPIAFTEWLFFFVSLINIVNLFIISTIF